MDEIQVAAYKILGSLYTLGIDPTLHRDRKYLKTEIDRHRPALGNCLGAYSSTFPVAFLEPHLNKHNQFSLLNRIADHSLEAQGKFYEILRPAVECRLVVASLNFLFINNVLKYSPLKLTTIAM